MLSFLDLSPLTGTMTFTFTTSTGLAISAGSVDYTNVTAVPVKTFHPVTCTVTRGPSILQGQPSNFTLAFSLPSVLKSGARLEFDIAKTEQRILTG
jgi:hypothetical protein